MRKRKREKDNNRKGKDGSERWMKRVLDWNGKVVIGWI